LLLTALVSLAALWLCVARFTLDSTSRGCFPQDLPWRLAERQMEQAFPQRKDLIVAVDAPRPRRRPRAEMRARHSRALRGRPVPQRARRRMRGSGAATACSIWTRPSCAT
jgi:hypothetical protein